jgi:subtilisin family serine protease
MKILKTKKKYSKSNSLIYIFKNIFSNTNKTKWKNTGFPAVFIIVSLLCSMSFASAALPSESENNDELIITGIQSIDLDESSFLSNKFLIKVEDASRKTIKESLKSDDTGIASLNNLNKQYGVVKFEPLLKHNSGSKKDSPLSNWYIVTLKTPKEKITRNSDQFVRFKGILDSYQHDPNINIAEPDYLINILTIPDDPYYSSSGSWGQSYPDLWGIKKISSEYAWDQSTGAASIIVADIDTGVDRNHADLKDNMWVNINEIPDNGIDDDANGYIDDYYGWDWVNDDNDPMDDHGHGTHTAGTIAAVGNNGNGVVGVNWNSRIMALKFLNSGGSGSLSDGVLALKYAADMGARVSSNSWGASGTSAVLDDAIQYEHDKGMVVVVAAGNSNADALGFTPASADRAVTVAASDHNDAKASFSNWGQKIDVAAPGVDILSVKAAINNMCTSSRGNIVGTDYCRVSGTSMATPHVSGLAALILAENPDLSNEEVRQLIRTGAVDLGPQGKDRDFGYGRIDADGSVSISNLRPLAPIITSPVSRTVVYGQAFKFIGSAGGPDFAEYKLEAGFGRDPAGWTTLAASTSQVTNDILATVDTTQLSDGIHIFRLTAIDTAGRSYQFQVHDIEVDNFDAEISSPVTLVSQGNINVLGSAQTKNGLPFDHYTMDWGEGTSPAAYSTSGITLTGSGQQPVDNSKLGTWDTSGLTPGQVYTLRLTVTSGSSVTSRYTTAVTVDQDLVAGWPKLISRSPNCMICEATPTVADLDNDGVNEVIITSPDNKIYVFRKDGTDFPGFPVSVTQGERFTWSANAADLDNDGTKEIIAATVTSSGTSKVYIIKSDGTFYPGWSNPVHVIGQQAGDGTPTIADLDGDGIKELVVIDPYYKKMHAYHVDGTELAGFPKTLPFTDLDYPGAPSIADLDNDGTPEIAYGLKDKLYVFDNQGNILSGWPFIAPSYNGRIINFESSPATGDIDGDGNFELLVIAHDGGVTTPVYAVKNDGTLLPDWPMGAGILSLGHSPMNSPSAVDVDDDGRDEVVVGLNTLSIFNLEGEMSIGEEIGAKISPAVSDVDGDGRFEFAGVRNNEVQIGNDDGSIYWERTFSTDARFFSPAVFSDLDNNGRVEFAVVQGRFSSDSGDLVVYIWELPETSSHPANGWPMFLHDPQRSGRLALSAPVNQTDDIAPSTSITSPADASTVSGTVNVTVSASDNVGVSIVELYRNNVSVGTKTSSPYIFTWDTTREENGEYTLQSKAYDKADNAGISSLITVNVSNDNTTPTVAITSPADASTVSGLVNVTVSASDNAGISKVELYRNDVLVGTKTSYPYIFTWDTTREENGQYTLQSKAYDKADNAGVSSLITVNVNNDNTAPKVSIISPTDASTVTGLVDVTVSASDNAEISKVELYRNNVLAGTKTSGPYIFTWDTTREENGEYTLQSKAYDVANNAGISSLITVNVNNFNDNTPPTVSIGNPLNNDNVQRKSTITITASAEDNVDVIKVEFYVNNILTCVDTSESYTCRWKVPARTGVTYVLQANAYDANGNKGLSEICEVTSVK